MAEHERRAIIHILPVAIDLEGSFENDGHSSEASQRHKGHEQVGRGEEIPGFHEVV